MSPRRGSILILVAGGAALLAALATAFMIRMRSSAEDTAIAGRETQARIMLLAACSYVLESSRLGYDRQPESLPKPKGHIEAFGWLDVRVKPSGPNDPLAAGPRDQTGASLVPAGSWMDLNLLPGDRPAARCPMHVWRRPPYAIMPTVAPNAIATADPAAPDFGRPYLRNRDPLPAAAAWAAFRDGDPTPMPQSTGLAWFRCYRESAARFVVTCGAGATEGWRDWNEIPAADRADFQNDPAFFEQLLAAERRMWYRIEWSAAVTPDNYHSIDYHVGGIGDHYYFAAVNGIYGNGDNRSQMRVPNPVGTIRWVERLQTPPANW
jgi:hypothetical protein